MAKRGRKPKAAQSGAGVNGEGNSAYFRKLFEENRKFLKTRSNQKVLDRWLADHPGFTEVPKQAKDSLANVKSLMRKSLRKRRGKPVSQIEEVETAAAVIAPAEPEAASSSELEMLEIQIDDCITLAKNIDRELLDDVINILRRARNAVVWKGGQ